ncbi:O-antigen/teichoic acid export membrane protein [Pedobacter sp. UYEF25]
MKIFKKFKSDDIRTNLANKNIVFLFVNKMFAAFISLQLIPATIGYVDSTQYGIWIALSSLVAWMVYFDFGLTHGFRNGFAVAKANNDIKLAKQYLATSYALLTVIFSVLLAVFLIINGWLSWTSILGVDKSLEAVLHKVFIIIAIFLSIRMIFNLFTTLLLANQEPALSAMIVTGGQFFSLVVIYILTFVTKGSLINLAYALVGVPVIILIVLTFYFFKTKFKEYAPSLLDINWNLSRSILGLGGKFFVIQFSMLFIFEFTNFIIIRLMGAEAVTAYTIAYRFFSIIYIAMGIVFLPFWSAFTDAYTKNEFAWMKATYSKLSKIWYLTILIFVVLLVISPLVYKYWLAKNLSIDFKLSLAMGINMIILSRANLYMLCLNGIGKVFVQMTVYLVFAFIAVPLMYIFTNLWGYYGIIAVTTLVYLCQSITGHLQLKMILNEKDYGVWSK